MRVAKSEKSSTPTRTSMLLGGGEIFLGLCYLPVELVDLEAP
jgi:hypothetical protein